jgi:hypothetical protein
MSGFISTRASSSRQAKKNAIQAMGAMDADVAEMAPREGSDVEMMSDGDGTDNDSSGLDDGSDDEYIEEAAGKRSAPAASAADEGPEEDLTEDALFQ